MAEPSAVRFPITRVHDDPGAGEYRVLVDRLWPRGISKERASLDEWLKEIAPSTALRRWYGHVPERFPEFSSRYEEELRTSPAADAVEHLLDVARTHPVTLVTATRDVDRSGARVLRDHLARRLADRRGRGRR